MKLRNFLKAIAALALAPFKIRRNIVAVPAVGVDDWNTVALNGIVVGGYKPSAHDEKGLQSLAREIAASNKSIEVSSITVQGGKQNNAVCYVYLTNGKPTPTDKLAIALYESLLEFQIHEAQNLLPVVTYFGADRVS